MSLITLIIAWIVGIIVADQYPLPLTPLSVCAVGLVLLAWLWRTNRLMTRSFGLLAVLLAGAARMIHAQPELGPSHIVHYAGQRVMLVGSVTTQPDHREAQQTVVLAVSAVDNATQVQVVTGNVQLHLPPLPELHYGQRLRVQGTLQLPESDGSFDYRAYLARRGIYVIMDEPQVAPLAGVGGSPLLRPLFYLNDRARTTALRLLPEPHASLLTGILLGVQATIPPDVLQAFSVTGISHVLVLSGWNISLVITATIRMLSLIGLHRRVAAWSALVMLALYVIFVGASPAVMRAAVMGVLVVWAELIGRTGEPWTLLFAAIGCLTALDPQVLWDIGFQLSALATAGLFAFAQPLDKRLAYGPLRSPFTSWATELLAATLGATVFAMPILLFYFGQLTLIAPLANLLVLPVVPIAMAAGALALLTALVWLPLGQVLALLSWPLLSWILAVARWLAALPWAAVSVRPFDLGWLWAFYVVAVGGWLWHRHRLRLKAGP